MSVKKHSIGKEGLQALFLFVPSSPAGLGFSSLVLRPKRRGFTGGTWFRPSDRARPALRCRNGVSAETPAIKRGVPGGISISPQNKFCGVPREFHRFPANELPEIRRRHSPAGVKRPPGGLSVHFPPVESGRMPRKTGFAGAPVNLTASVAGKTGSLRHDGGTRRRSPLCGQTAQARRGPRSI